MLLWLLLPVLCVGADPVYILHDTPAPAQALARGLTQRGIDVKLEGQPASKAI